MGTKCGYYSDDFEKIVYCPLHSSAPLLLEALKVVYDQGVSEVVAPIVAYAINSAEGKE